MPELEVERVGAKFVRAAQATGLFAVRVGDRAVALISLEALELARVAHTAGVPWVELLEAPTADLTAALMLIAAAEAHCGIEEDELEALSVAELMERFVRIPPRENGSE